MDEDLEKVLYPQWFPYCVTVWYSNFPATSVGSHEIPPDLISCHEYVKQYVKVPRMEYRIMHAVVLVDGGILAHYMK